MVVTKPTGNLLLATSFPSYSGSKRDENYRVVNVDLGQNQTNFPIFKKGFWISKYTDRVNIMNPKYFVMLK